MNTVFSSIRVSRYQPGVRLAAHAHDSVSFSLVLAGDYEETIRGRSASHAAGSLLVCPSDEPHAQHFGAAGLYKLVLEPTHATLDRLSELTRLATAPSLRSHAITDVGRRIVTELRRDDAFSSMVVEGLSHELIGLFARGHAAGDSAFPAYLTAAIDYMREVETASCRLDDIAAVLGCDPARLSHAFQRHLGCTLGEYQRQLRVERAGALLSATPLPISEIAAMCGFSDQPHLNRAFKAQTGITPAAWRRKHS